MMVKNWVPNRTEVFGDSIVKGRELCVLSGSFHSLRRYSLDWAYLQTGRSGFVWLQWQNCLCNMTKTGTWGQERQGWIMGSVYLEAGRKGDHQLNKAALPLRLLNYILKQLAKSSVLWKNSSVEWQSMIFVAWLEKMNWETEKLLEVGVGAAKLIGWIKNCLNAERFGAGINRS